MLHAFYINQVKLVGTEIGNDTQIRTEGVYYTDRKSGRDAAIDRPVRQAGRHACTTILQLLKHTVLLCWQPPAAGTAYSKVAVRWQCMQRGQRSRLHDLPVSSVVCLHTVLQ
jgi:hypothetical protein